MVQRRQKLEPASRSSVESWVRKFSEQTKAFLRSRGILVERFLVTDWQAHEDPTWRQYVIGLTIRAKSEQAMQVWDEINIELAKAIKAEPKPFRPLLQERVSIAVNWTNDSF